MIRGNGDNVLRRVRENWLKTENTRVLHSNVDQRHMEKFATFPKELIRSLNRFTVGILGIYHSCETICILPACQLVSLDTLPGGHRILSTIHTSIPT